MTGVLTAIPVEQIRVAVNDRKTFDQGKLDELAASIGEVGLAEPIIVATDGTGFELVAGERRLRAVRDILGLPTIDAIVRTMTADERGNMMLAENTGRVDLSIMEEARAYQRRIDSGHTVDQIARLAGVAPFRVRWRLDLLALTPEAQAAVECGTLSAAAALEMRRLDGDRQIIAMKAWLANPSMGTPAFKRLCVDLLAQQYEPEAFTLLAEEWVAKAAAAKPRPTVAQLTDMIRRLADLAEKAMVDAGWITAGQPGDLITEARTLTERINP